MRWASQRCKPQRGRLWYGQMRSGAARRALIRHGTGCDGSTEGLRAFPAAFIGGQGSARLGAASCGAAGRGWVGRGPAGFGKGHRRWHGAPSRGFPATLTEGGQRAARHGGAG